MLDVEDPARGLDHALSRPRLWRLFHRRSSIVTYFQAPADRKFDPVQGLGVWPDTADAYRFFTGVPGEERIGIRPGSGSNCN